MFSIEERPARVIATSDEMGTAYSHVSPDFEGSCRVELEGRCPAAVVFPSRQDAEAAAKFAVGMLGGYYQASVFEASGQTPTHESWTQWAFES
jgi:hypothetical protein